MDTSKYKALYLQETGEHLSGIEEGLLALEKRPGDAAAVDDLFRHYHSIKGMSASMGYEPIQRLAHRQEDLLDRVRQKKLALSGAMTSALLGCLDGMKVLVRLVEQDAPLELDIQPFIVSLKEAMEGGAQAAEAPGLAPAPEPRAQGRQAEAVDGGLRLSNVMKVDGSVFDGLLATVGDLFMVLSLFKGRSQEYRDIEFKDGVHMLGKAINALHSSILSARMLPVADLTANLPRLVRDMAKDSGKLVEFSAEGTELSLDRSILESLGGPLVHIIRNAVDHGIEGPGERQAAGKPPAATVSLRAFGRRDRAVIEVSDDGRGIDAEKIRRRAIERGAPEKKVRAMTDREACMLVCLPGVSSADAVTATSGRGVGMDVVKDAIEGLGGTLDIDSSPGRGTRIILELPRTTSIVKSLLVTVRGEQFLIPISRIEKVVETESRQAAPSFRMDGADVPVVPLSGLLGMEEGPQNPSCTLIVVEARPRGEDGDGKGGNRLIALKADDFGAELDAYVKPLVPPMSRLWGVSGIAIMGDGRPAFLLDLPQIISRAAAAAP